MRRYLKKKYGKARTSYRRRRVMRRRTYRSKKAILKRRNLYKKTNTVPEVKTLVADCSEKTLPFNVAERDGVNSGHQIHLYDPTASPLNNTGDSFFPIITTGQFKDRRIGNKIVCTSSVIKFRFTGQVNQSIAMKYEICIFKKVRDSTQNFTLTDFIHPDAFSPGVRFTPNCDRVNSSFRNYIVLYRKVFHCPEDSQPGSNWVKDHKIIIKHKGPTVYDDDYNSNPYQIQYGDIGCLVTCNGGDRSAAAQTGLSYRWNHRLHFVDP